MQTYVLRVWALDDDGAPASRLELVEITAAGARAVAAHAGGVSASDAFLHAAGMCSYARLWSGDVTDEQVLAAAGEDLYARLAQGDVGVALASLGQNVRVRVDVRSAALEALPWELTRRGGQRLFMRPVQPWSLGSERVPPLDPAVPGPTPGEPPVRVLIVIGAREDDERVRGEEELRRLEDCLHRCRTRLLLKSLVRPTSEEIRSALARFRPHVFHFIGHGDEVAGVPVFCVWSDREQTTTNWNADDVQAALAEAPSVPRLVVLNACQLGKPRATWALTEAFLDAGALAVLAMQADIGGDAGVTFGDALYRSLATDEPLDVATTRARLAIANAGESTSWPLPRLIARGPMDEVLPARVPRAPRTWAVDDFVHRWDQRLQAWEALCPLEEGCSRLIVVEGEEASGKTELLKLLGDMWTSVWTYPALYVHGGQRTSDLTLLVQDIRTQAAADGFDPEPLSTLPMSGSISELASALRSALETYAKPRPLLFLLDGLHHWDANALVQTVVHELCEPYLGADPSSNVRIVVALRPHPIVTRRWSEMDIAPVRLGGFPPQEWRRGASQFIRLQCAKLAAEQRETNEFELGAWPCAGLRAPDEILDQQRRDYAPSLLGLIRSLRTILQRR